MAMVENKPIDWRGLLQEMRIRREKELQKKGRLLKQNKIKLSKEELRFFELEKKLRESQKKFYKIEKKFREAEAQYQSELRSFLQNWAKMHRAGKERSNRSQRKSKVKSL
jgi:hypothetical protein